VSPGWIAFILVAAALVAWAAFVARIVRRRETVRADDDAAAARPSLGEYLRAKLHRSKQETVTAPREEVDSSGRQPAVTVTKIPEPQRKPITEDQVAMSRRQFLNRAWGVSALIFMGVFGMGTLSFLWPSLQKGFGTKLSIGKYDDLLAKIGPDNDFTPQFFPEGRFWLTYYDGTGDDPVYIANGAKKYKMQALYRKCVHLGCSVPFCNKSSLFECPCHGSKYLLTGEYFAGPAPRGLDRFPIEVTGGKVFVDTAKVVTGPPRGTVTWSKFGEPKGPFCVPT
jgi:cytochrome b6-f complex iron-sulfur subunit